MKYSVVVALVLFFSFPSAVYSQCSLCALDEGKERFEKCLDELVLSSSICKSSICLTTSEKKLFSLNLFKPYVEELAEKYGSLEKLYDMRVIYWGSLLSPYMIDHIRHLNTDKDFPIDALFEQIVRKKLSLNCIVDFYYDFMRSKKINNAFQKLAGCVGYSEPSLRKAWYDELLYEQKGIDKRKNKKKSE